MIRVGIIRTAAGNIGSIVNMLKHIDVEPVIVDKPQQKTFEHLILPGVGSFERGRQGLADSGLDDYIFSHINSGHKLLGMCLGMQLLLNGSEEGQSAGLGLIDGRCELIRPADPSLKVPHMGWNWVRPTQESIISAGVMEPQKYYFSHSYKAVGVPEAQVFARTSYDGPVVAAVGKDGVAGVQFHPEKSHHYGINLFRRFVKWT